MDLSKILSVSGKAGLYKMVAQAKNGAIVESLADKKRIQIFSGDNASTLEEISIYTLNDDLPLKDVFKKMYENLKCGKALESKADEKSLKSFFEEIIPDYDKDRVYVSHIRKILSWYNLLLEHNLLEFEDEDSKKEEPIAEKPKE
ncbi:MAG: DUF5606 domain-containing protein [Lentimicrobiaceae bacterium]|nr:DUF5606 domain-containing protein [Lentimicrobiaceae bacterium]